MLNGRLNTVSATVDTTSSSLSTMRSEWTEFIRSLPALQTMYNEVKMIIDLLPKGMWDTIAVQINQIINKIYKISQRSTLIGI